ncbi:hypothetical protein Tco_0533366 [Tanacetum coccineum]
MAESSSPEITPKEELVTLDKPKSLNPFLPANQVEFTFEEIALTSNNEVALLYPSHPKSNYFEIVSDFISKFGYPLLMAQVHLLQSQNDKLEQQKEKAEAKVAELKTLKWELLAKFLALPSQISSVQAKLQTFDTLLSLLNKVANTLTRFTSIIKNASHTAKGKGVPSVGPTTPSPAEGEKNTNPATKDAETRNLHNELMLKRRESSKIINYDVLTQNGPITLQVYREDGTIEVIPNIKVSDLHLAEWKEVVQACLDRKEKGWKTIYRLIKTRMEYLNQTEKELKFDFNKPLKEQDPLNELNDLANKKKKRTGDLKDHSRSTKKHKSIVQHEEEALRRLGSIFTSVYATYQKLKNAYKVYKAGKRLLYIKRNKAISFGKGEKESKARLAKHDIYGSRENVSMAITEAKSYRIHANRNAMQGL